jgi:serine/threonine-protein kinase RsbW
VGGHFEPTVMAETQTSPVPIRLKVPSSKSCLAVICTFVEGACGALAPELGAGTIHDVELAVNEACTNIIEHAYAGDETEWIWITAERDGEQLVFTTTDSGRPAGERFDARLRACEPKGELREHGYGLVLIRRVMDEVSYRSDEKLGNVLTMTKCLPPASEGEDP